MGPRGRRPDGAARRAGPPGRRHAGPGTPGRASPSPGPAPGAAGPRPAAIGARRPGMGWRGCLQSRGSSLWCALGVEAEDGGRARATHPPPGLGQGIWTAVRYCIASALVCELMVAALTEMARLTPTTFTTFTQ